MAVPSARNSGLERIEKVFPSFCSWFECKIVWITSAVLTGTVLFSTTIVCPALTCSGYLWMETIKLRISGRPVYVCIYIYIYGTSHFFCEGPGLAGASKSTTVRNKVRLALGGLFRQRGCLRRHIEGISDSHSGRWGPRSQRAQIPNKSLCTALASTFTEHFGSPSDFSGQTK